MTFLLVVLEEDLPKELRSQSLPDNSNERPRSLGGN